MASHLIKIIAGILFIGCFSAPGLAREVRNVAELPLALHQPIEEVQVWGGKQGKVELEVAPTTEISTLEMENINLSTIEDAVSYEPNMVVRRRYIGDANGSLGIRGANMFQTARTMVYADGLPLHYHLQTRWSGAPRWSLIAPDEVESVEVIYGPFSAAYSGNAMGGVVRIKTLTPTGRSLKLHGALFNQNYNTLATREDYSGGRFSASHSDKLGNLTLFTFYNHLKNEGQPMTQYFAAPTTNDTTATEVTGGIVGTDNYNNSVIYYGDSGTEKSTTDLFKLKAGYNRGGFHLYTTLAYEDRSGTSEELNNFLRDARGETFWNGNARLNGQTFGVIGANLAEHAQDRQSLLAGVGLSGPLGGSWTFDLNASQFDLLSDVATQSNVNPADPDFDGTGRVTEYDDTGWRTADFSANTTHLGGHQEMELKIGAHFNHYQLILRTFDSANYRHRDRTAARPASGGETDVRALFAEYTWQFNPLWDITLGGRYEHWQARDGFVGEEQHPDRSADGFSPKFSLGFTPTPVWALRYSVGRALRFPLIEELYQNESRATAVQTGNARLQPEDGLHHNLMLERTLADGFARLNIFRDRVDDTIFNQFGIVEGVEISTFLAIDEAVTDGAELILNQQHVLQSRLDVRFNISYLNAKISRNSVNPSTEDNRFPRLPEWQSNLLLIYRLNEQLHLSSGLRYASNSFGDLANADTASRTFGAHDSYLFLNMRANWRATEHFEFALGMDNVTNEVAYVHHPWPSRTAYLEADYEF